MAERLQLDIGTVTYEEAALFQATTGISLTRAIVEWRAADLSVEALYGLVWLARRKAGEPDLSFLEVQSLPWLDAAGALDPEVSEPEPDPTDGESSTD